MFLLCHSEKPMTPFETLLWNVWLPKVRSCLNNDWSPQEPQPAVKLYEAWSTFLPPFICDNVLDQLILPKIQQSVSDWNLRKDTMPLQSLVFPWLPHLGLRLEDVLGDAKRKIKSLLRNWSAGDGMPKDLAVWKDVSRSAIHSGVTSDLLLFQVFDAGDWDTMLLKYIVPKLGALLRNDFRVDPRKQNMEPLEQVLSWSTIIRPSIFSQLIETEFFPKWLDILHIWLIQPKVSFEEVAQWYQFWKEAFPANVQTMSGVFHGFTCGLQLMNKAIELGPDAPTRLPRPDHVLEQLPPTSPKRNGTPTPKVRPVRTQEVTFRSVVEDFAASHNLLFIPTGRAHEKSRMPLFRVSQTADGKGGLLVYILDEAIWAADGEEYRAITPQDMVVRASK
jgi:tuftelin-interacting protein 11